MSNPKASYYCFRCETDKPLAEMHCTLAHKEQICKECNVKRAGKRHLAKVKAKRDEYTEQQSERKENKRAKAKLEVDKLLSGALLTRGKPSTRSVKTRRAIEAKWDEMALNEELGSLS
jgi:hypothetical protein